MKTDLVTNLSSSCILRAWSKTNPKEAPVPGGGKDGVTS